MSDLVRLSGPRGSAADGVALHAVQGLPDGDHVVRENLEHGVDS